MLGFGYHTWEQIREIKQNLKDVVKREYGSTVRPKIVDARSRGAAARFEYEGKDLIVKPVQSPEEYDIAYFAGNRSLGPKQDRKIPGYIAEEFMSGTLFADLPKSQRTNETMHSLGAELGTCLAVLHGNKIAYNDVHLYDHGECHFLVLPSGEALLIDFGSAANVAHPKELSDHAIYNCVRATALAATLEAPSQNPTVVQETARQYRSAFNKLLPKHMLSSDIRLVSQGIRDLSLVWGYDFAKPFVAGFDETYNIPGVRK